MSILGTFQPDTLTTGVAPCRSAEFQVTVTVCDSPGNSVMSLPCQIEDCSSLSPDSSWPLAVPRRTSALSRKDRSSHHCQLLSHGRPRQEAPG